MKFQVNFGHSGLFRRSPTEIDVSSSVKFFCFWEESNVKLASHFSPQFRSALLPNDLWIVRERKKRKWTKSSAWCLTRTGWYFGTVWRLFTLKTIAFSFCLEVVDFTLLTTDGPSWYLICFRLFPNFIDSFSFSFFFFSFFLFENHLRYWLFFFFWRIPYVIDLFLINNWSLVRLKSVNSTKVLFGNQVPYKPDSH